MSGGIGGVRSNGSSFEPDAVDGAVPDPAAPPGAAPAAPASAVPPAQPSGRMAVMAGLGAGGPKPPPGDDSARTVYGRN